MRKFIVRVSKDIRNSLQEAFEPQPSVGSTSIGQSSRPNTIGTFASSYYASRRDGIDKGGEDNVGNGEWMLINNNKFII